MANEIIELLVNIKKIMKSILVHFKNIGDIFSLLRKDLMITLIK